MAGKREKPEEIVSKLRQVEVLQGQGMTIADAVRQIGVTQNTYYRWRKLYGGMGRDHRQADFRTGFTPDHLDDLPQLHPDNVHRFGFSLANGDDLVPGMELAGHLGGATREQTFDDTITINVAELSAYADKCVADRDGKLLGGVP